MFIHKSFWVAEKAIFISAAWEMKSKYKRTDLLFFFSS